LVEPAGLIRCGGLAVRSAASFADLPNLRFENFVGKLAGSDVRTLVVMTAVE
jgi:hypothetical protein